MAFGEPEAGGVSAVATCTPMALMGNERCTAPLWGYEALSVINGEQDGIYRAGNISHGIAQRACNGNTSQGINGKAVGAIDWLSRGPGADEDASAGDRRTVKEAGSMPVVSRGKRFRDQGHRSVRHGEHDGNGSFGRRR